MAVKWFESVPISTKYYSGHHFHSLGVSAIEPLPLNVPQTIDPPIRGRTHVAVIPVNRRASPIGMNSCHA